MKKISKSKLKTKKKVVEGNYQKDLNKKLNDNNRFKIIMYIARNIKKLLWPKQNQEKQSNKIEVDINGEVKKTLIEQWNDNPKTTLNMELYLFRQKNIDLIIQNMHGLFSKITRKQFIKEVIISYRHFLRNKKSELQVVEKFRILEQIHRLNKYEALINLIQSQFNYDKLQILNYDTSYDLLEKVLQLQLDFNSKKQVLLEVMPYCYLSIQNFLIDYIDLNLDINYDVLRLFMINTQQLKQINKHEENQEIQIDFFIEIHYKILMIIITEFNNFEDSAKYLTKLLEQKCIRLNYKKMLFDIKLCAFTYYKLNRQDLDYNKISKITITELFKEILLSEKVEKLRQLKPIFEIVGKQFLEKSFEDFGLNSDCDMQITMQMLKKQFIIVIQSTASKLIKKIKNGYFQYCKYIQSINYIFGQFYADEIEEIIMILQFARIFYFFNINNKIQIIQSILKCENNPQLMKNAQQTSLELTRMLINNYCLNKFRDKQIIINEVTIQISDPQSILVICLYLKQNLFNNILTESTIYQMIFQHLIHFSRFQELRVLLSKQKIDHYEIEYTMIQMIVIEQIYSLFEKSMSFPKIARDLQQRIDLLKTQTDQKKIVVSLYELACYLHIQDVPIPPMKLIHNLNIKLLYEISEKNPMLDFEKIYILIIIAKSLNKSRLYSKQFIKFKGNLAIKLFKNGFQDEGIKILNQINVDKPGWFCQIIFQILLIYKGRWSYDLLILGFDAATNRNHFQQFRKRMKQIGEQQQKKVDENKDEEIQYNVTDFSLVLKPQHYTRLVCEIKNEQQFLEIWKFQLFFILLGNDHKRAFHYTINQKLEFKKIEFFIKQCIRQGVINPIVAYRLMYKTILYGLSKQFLFYNTSFSDFKSELSEKDFFQESKVQELYQKLIKNQQLKKSDLITLLISYHEFAQISFIFSIKYLYQNIQKNKIIEYFENKNYRSVLIKQLVIKINFKDHMTILQNICQFDHIQLANYIIDGITNYINTNNFSKELQLTLLNLQKLCQTQQRLKQIINNFTKKSHSIKNLVIFIKFIYSTKCNLFLQVIIEQNLTVIESLAKFDRQNSLKCLLADDCLTEAFNFKSNINLSDLQKQILERQLKLQNIFIISKAMYLMNGLNKAIQKQIWQIFSKKSITNKDVWEKIKLKYK